MADLFEAEPPAEPWEETISGGAKLLHGFALAAGFPGFRPDTCRINLTFRKAR